MHRLQRTTKLGMTASVFALGVTMGGGTARAGGGGDVAQACAEDLAKVDDDTCHPTECSCGCAPNKTACTAGGKNPDDFVNEPHDVMTGLKLGEFEIPAVGHFGFLALFKNKSRDSLAECDRDHSDYTQFRGELEVDLAKSVPIFNIPINQVVLAATHETEGKSHTNTGSPLPGCGGGWHGCGGSSNADGDGSTTDEGSVWLEKSTKVSELVEWHVGVHGGGKGKTSYTNDSKHDEAVCEPTRDDSTNLETIDADGRVGINVGAQVTALGTCLSVNFDADFFLSGSKWTKTVSESVTGESSHTDTTSGGSLTCGFKETLRVTCAGSRCEGHVGPVICDTEGDQVCIGFGLAWCRPSKLEWEQSTTCFSY